MIDPANVTAHAVESVLDALRGTVQEHVQSSEARTALLSSIRLLARVLDELAIGPELARTRLADWQALRLELDACLAPGAARHQGSRARETVLESSPYHAMMREVLEMQSLLRTSAAEPGTKHLSDWLGRAIALHIDLFESREAALLQVTAPAVVAEDTTTGPLREALRLYLRERYPRLASDALQTVRILPGGYSKQTALLELAANDELPSRLVLRRDAPEGGSTGTTVANEFPLLAQMHTAGLPVPRPLFCEADRTRIGGGFVVMEEVVGAARAGELFPELNSDSTYHADFPFELARVLANLHGITSLPGSYVPSGFVAHGGEAPAMVRGFREIWLGLPSPPLTALVDAGYGWLLSNPIPPARPRRVVHADVGAHNILLRDGHLAALLDWELTHLGDPAEDLAFVRTLLIEPLVPWQRFVDAYLAAGGLESACDRQAVNWFSVWNHVRNCTYTSILHGRVREGVLRDVSNVAAGWDYTARVQRYLAQDLRRALHETCHTQ